jgi:hypothetical protein
MLGDEPRGHLTGSEATIMTTSTTPTIVLVRGAFADSSGFTGVIRQLQSARFPPHFHRPTGDVTVAAAERHHDRNRRRQ